jgi:hypothetical protein
MDTPNSINTGTKRGYVAISIVLILMAVTLGISMTLSFLSSGNSKTAESMRKGEQALFNSESCLEEGLLRFKRDLSYEGGTVAFPSGECHISLKEESGIYTFQVYFSGEENYWRGIEAQAETADGLLKMTHWNEKVLVVK